MRHISLRLLAVGFVAILCAVSIAFAPQISRSPIKPNNGRFPITSAVTSEAALGLNERRRIDFHRTRNPMKIDQLWKTENNSLPLHQVSIESLGRPPENPLLRIETGQHSGRIWYIDIDEENRFLVTGSEDKTARVWLIPNNDRGEFRLLRILRPPIGQGEDGEVYPVSISPDGATIALGGWTCVDWNNAFCVYVFDRETGSITQVLTDLPGFIASLDFSPDGQYLAAGLGATGGLRVWRTADWTPVNVENSNDYGGQLYALSFSPDGRLAAGSLDGSLRIYDQQFGLVRVWEDIFDGAGVGGVAFSQDGRLAVSCIERPDIAVIAADGLEELFRPRLDGLEPVRENALFKVAWSSDGNELYAAGYASQLFSDAGEKNFIRRFSEAGQGVHLDIPVSNHIIIGMHPSDDRLYFGTQDPAFGFLDSDLIKNFVGPKKIDFEPAELNVSQDGRVISMLVPSDDASTDRWIFDVVNRDLASGLVGDGILFSSPRTSSEAISVRNWQRGLNPTINGHEIDLEFGNLERSLSLAIAPSDDRILLGADYQLRLIDGEGKTIWAYPGPGAAWQVNISGDGSLAVVAYDDGTVRWHDMRDGSELLALYVVDGEDRNRWILWTPSGFYDATPGAEDLIGWHINQGPATEPLFFAASRFRDLFYQRDIGETVLSTFEVAEPPNRTELLNAAPPIVDIFRQETQKNGDLEIVYVAQTIFGDPVDLDIFIDNAKLSRVGSNRSPNSKAAQITIPRGGCADSISITAIDDSGRRSDARTITPRGAVSIGICDSRTSKKPRLTALVIGVSTYSDSTLRLEYADHDARDIAEAFSAQSGKAFEEVEIVTLTNESATKENIVRAFEALNDNNNATSDDVTVVFFAGHGMKSEAPGSIGRQEKLFLLPQDADIGDLDETAINVRLLYSVIGNRVGRKFVFLDACYSGFTDRSGVQIFDNDGAANVLAGSDYRAEVFTSSSSNQVSYEDERWENGAFTEAVLEGLYGQADKLPDDGRVSNRELSAYLDSRVYDLTGRQQTPTYTAQGSVRFELSHVD